MYNYLYKLATDTETGVIAGLMKFILLILSLIYALIVRTLSLCYILKPSRLKCRVISVGNITLGGTGKTSLVEFIARYLKGQGHKVAILSRGYKRKIPNPNGSTPLTIGTERSRSTKPQIKNYETIGDEPFMLWEKLGGIPVIVGKDRIRSAQIAIKDYSADTVILDDGFQQWRMKKDLEIVTVDATRPFGNRRLIPRGILREPLSALKRADIIVLTKTNLKPGNEETKVSLKRLNPSALILESIHKPVGFCRVGKEREFLKPGALTGRPVALASGIADPRSFESLMSGLGANISLVFRFPDHYNYAQKDLARIMQEAQNKDIDTIVTTEKDAVRMAPILSMLALSSINFLALAIELQIKEDEQGLYNRLSRLYSA